MKVVASEAHLLHTFEKVAMYGLEIPAVEVPERAETIRRTLAADEVFDLGEASEHGSEPITAVHDPEMLVFLEGAWSEWRRSSAAPFPSMIGETFLHPGLLEGMGPLPAQDSVFAKLGAWCFDTSTPIVPGTYVAARAAVDVALTAADLVLGGEQTTYGLCRPPGHHTARAVFGGFCYFNNAAITAEYLAKETGEPVAILDVDYHHGNGTQQIFYSRPDVFYASLHGDPRRAYPYYTGYADELGAGVGRGTNLNIPLEAGTDDAAYLDAIDVALDALSSFGGSTIVVSLGMDTYGQDPICDLALTTPVYHDVGRRVASLGRRMVILQEGGYYLPALGENVRQWLLGADGR